jgi:hypothetical protein
LISNTRAAAPRCSAAFRSSTGSEASERLEKHVAAFLHVMHSTETYRAVDDVMREARVPEDEATEVAAYLEREEEPLIARLDNAPRRGKEWMPRKP